MHNHIKKLIILALLVSSTASPLNEKWVIPGTVAGGVGGGAAGYFISSALEGNKTVQVISTLAGAAGLGFLTNWILYSMTPQGRYERAMKTLNNACENGFIRLELDSEDPYQSLKKYCKRHFESDWYLVTGKEKLNRLKNDIIWAWSTLDYAHQEANVHLAAQCRDAKALADQLQEKTLTLLDLVDSDSAEYHRQRKAYDAYLERLQRDQHHNEDRADRWADRADKSRDKSLDRKLKRELHDEKMDKKNKKKRISDDELFNRFIVTSHTLV